MPIGAAVESIHFPADQETLDRALDRLAFDELLALQVGMVSRRRLRERDRASTVEVSDARLRGPRRHPSSRPSVARSRHAPGATQAPVSLTADQRTAVDRAACDLASGRPMMRLVQGDVGSGKTAVAALAMAFVADAGGQSALLAPTDLLARQHAATLSALLEPLGHDVLLLTGSVSAGERREALALAEAPSSSTLMGRSRGLVFVGTQALIGEHIGFADLRLAVVDEQHRFGVEEREALSAKGGSVHVLLMTATPIPQVLGQVIHADLDVRPACRARGSPARASRASSAPAPWTGTWSKVAEEARPGRRTFVVVPLIEAEGADDDGPEVGSAADESAGPVRRRLGRDGGGSPDQLLAPLRVGMVHGRLRAAERDEVMGRFRDGKLDVLVGTTVVEVGVDVPDATMMIIESADRFGLAQLHQLRGRVGRGTHQSYCVLVTDAAEDSVAMTRLRAVQRHHRRLRARRAGHLAAQGRGAAGPPTERPATPARGAPGRPAASAACPSWPAQQAERLVGPDGRLVDGPGAARTGADPRLAGAHRRG